MIVSEIPPVAAERRAEILRLSHSPETHAALLSEMPFDDVVEVRPPEAPAEPREELRVAAWNAERGRSLEQAAPMLEAIRADVLLLSELDAGMARTAQRHTARELAARLGCGYAFAVEFLELGLGDERERDAARGASNAVGYHGGAILSRLPIEEPRVVRLERRGDWFDGERGERRVGGRIAVLCRVGLASGPVALASAHLDSHSSPQQRAEEMGVLLAALEELAGGGPAVIGGDLNTHSLGPAELSDRQATARAMQANPDRFTDPIPHEPLFERAAKAGFDWHPCNVATKPTHRTSQGQTILKLDWLLCRGLRASEPTITPALDPTGTKPLSDHDAIAATFRQPRDPPSPQIGP